MLARVARGQVNQRSFGFISQSNFPRRESLSRRMIWLNAPLAALA
jgi:phage head maturation protease